MLHNSLGKLKNTGKWQFALFIFKQGNIQCSECCVQS